MNTSTQENIDSGTTQGTGVIPISPSSLLTSRQVFDAADLGIVRALFGGDIIEDPETGTKVEQWRQVWEGEPEFLLGVFFTRPRLVHTKERVRESYYSVSLNTEPPRAA